MLSLSRKDRCKSCHTERALRLCPRTKKGICWKCCNEKRIDLNCPQSCPYAPKLEEGSPFPAFKSDNNHEAVDAIKGYIKIWITKQQAAFEDNSPMDMARQDKAKLLDILSKYQYPGNFPIDCLMETLGLKHEKAAEIQTAEDVVGKYLDHVITLEYSQLRSLTMNVSPIADLAERYSSLMGKNVNFKQLKNYSYIHSSLSEDGAESIVFVEFNHRHEYTFVLRNEDGKWYIRQSLNGNPALYFKQNDLHQRIATYLGNGEDKKAHNEISEALRSYPDSADLYYYKALYWLLIKQPDQARPELLNSVALDNSFTPPYMHLGLLALNDKNYGDAKLWLAALVQIDPDNLDAINNLGIVHLADGDKEGALTLWREVLSKSPNYEMAKKNLELYG